MWEKKKIKELSKKEADYKCEFVGNCTSIHQKRKKERKTEVIKKIWQLVP